MNAERTRYIPSYSEVIKDTHRVEESRPDASSERLNFTLNDKEIDLHIPSTEYCEEVLVDRKAKEHGRPSVRLTKEGRALVDANWRTILGAAGENPDLLQIEEFLDEVFQSLKSRLSGSERHLWFIKSMETSAAFRLERMKNTELLEKLRASNGSTSRFAETLSVLYPTRKSTYVESLMLPVLGRLRRMIDQELSEQARDLDEKQQKRMLLLAQSKLLDTLSESIPAQLKNGGASKHLETLMKDSLEDWKVDEKDGLSDRIGSYIRDNLRGLRADTGERMVRKIRARDIPDYATLFKTSEKELPSTPSVTKGIPSETKTAAVVESEESFEVILPPRFLPKALESGENFATEVAQAPELAQNNVHETETTIKIPSSVKIPPASEIPSAGPIPPAPKIPSASGIPPSETLLSHQMQIPVTQEVETAVVKPEIPEDKTEAPIEKGISWQNRIMASIEKILESKQDEIQKIRKVGEKAAIAMFILAIIVGIGARDVDSKHQSVSAPSIGSFLKGVSPDTKYAKIAEYLKVIEGDITEPVSIDSRHIIEDESFVRPGASLCYADILYRMDRMTRAIFPENGGDPSGSLAKKYVNTVKLLLSAKKLWPQAVRFEVVEDRGNLTLQPVDWEDDVRVKERDKADILIVGGELESVATAIHAADRGLNVTLVYAGALGGLSSDSGGNMRFFDAVLNAPMTDVQKKIMHDALGMAPGNEWSLPDGVSERLVHYLHDNYPQVTLVGTRTLNSLHVDGEAGKITGITTEEGIQIEAGHVIDSDPEAVVAEKSGDIANIETPNMGYGMVFDVKGLDDQVFEDLESRELLSPDNILQIAGVSREQIRGNSVIEQKIRDLENSYSGAKTPNKYITYGYEALGSAYDLYMNCLELKHDGKVKAELNELNKERRMSGFNIAIRNRGEATFNSISYSFDDQTSIRQGDHDLYKDSDSRFERIRDVEIPSLEGFLIKLTGNHQLSVVMPRELYVRRAVATFETLGHYSDEDFSRSPKTNMWMTYHNDVRAAEPRDSFDSNLDRVYQTQQSVPDPTWDIRPETALTPIEGLALIGKSNGANPVFNGNLRIIQNAIGHGCAIVDSIADGTADQKFKSLKNPKETKVAQTSVPKDSRLLYVDSWKDRKGVVRDGMVLGLSVPDLEKGSKLIPLNSIGSYLDTNPRSKPTENI